MAVSWPLIGLTLAHMQGWWRIQRVVCTTESGVACPKVVTEHWQAAVGQSVWFWPNNSLASSLIQTQPSFRLRSISLSWDGVLQLQYQIPPHLVQLVADNHPPLTIDTEGQVRDEPSQAFTVFVDGNTWQATADSRHTLPATLSELRIAADLLSSLTPQVPELSLSLQHPSIATISSTLASASAERAELSRDLQKFTHLAPLLSARKLPYVPATIDLRPRYPVVRPFNAPLPPATASSSATPSATARSASTPSASPKSTTSASHSADERP